MKKKTFIALAVASLLLNLIFLAHASTTLIGSMATVNDTTTNSTSVAITTYTPSQPTFFISNGGSLSSTNELTVNAQLSFDGTNFFTVATYNPSGLSATTDTWRPTLNAIPVYLRSQIVTTGSVQVGIILQ